MGRNETHAPWTTPHPGGTHKAREGSKRPVDLSGVDVVEVPFSINLRAGIEDYQDGFIVVDPRAKNCRRRHWAERIRNHAGS